MLFAFPSRPMLTTESTIVRAFKRRNVVAPPPAPPLSQEALHRRQAALRQMGLIPPLTLSQQEAHLDSLIPPSSPVDDDSEANRIKNEWVANNQDTPLPPSPPLTPLTTTDDITTRTPETTEPTDTSRTATKTIETTSQNATTTAPTPAEQETQPQLPHSPISNKFHSPSLLHPPRVDSSSGLPLPCPPFRSRSPSLAGSDTKSTTSRSKSRARSSLRFFTRGANPKEPPPLPISDRVSPQTKTEEEAVPHPPPPPQQRKRTVFARFKRANTALPPSNPTQGQTPNRSKSLFTSVRKTVFGPAGSGAATDNIGGGGGVSPTTAGEANLNVNAVPSRPSSPTTTATATSNPNPLSLDTPVSDMVQDKAKVEEEDRPPVLSDPLGLGSVAQRGEVKMEEDQVEFPSDNHQDRERERCPSVAVVGSPAVVARRKGPGKGIGISVILNRERKTSGSPSPLLPSPVPPSPRSYLSSPPASPTPTTPTTTTTTHARLGGKLGRKGTTTGEGLLSVWGGVAGLLGGGGAASFGDTGTEVGDLRERQALSPTIHNEASILLHMSHIEDEEMRRVTEVAFM